MQLRCVLAYSLKARSKFKVVLDKLPRENILEALLDFKYNQAWLNKSEDYKKQGLEHR